MLYIFICMLYIFIVCYIYSLSCMLYIKMYEIYGISSLMSIATYDLIVALFHMCVYYILAYCIVSLMLLQCFFNSAIIVIILTLPTGNTIFCGCPISVTIPLPLINVENCGYVKHPSRLPNTMLPHTKCPMNPSMVLFHDNIVQGVNVYFEIKKL